MSTVTVSVVPYRESMARAKAVLASGKADIGPRINFESWAVFHRVLAPNRVAVLQAMSGAGPLAIREVARRVDRDFKGVHTDIAALLEAGLVEKTPDGMVVFPYDTIHFDFEITGQAQSAA